VASSEHLPLVRVPWTVLSVGEDLRSLDLLCRAGGSIRGEPVISVLESRTEIVITIEMPDRSAIEEFAPLVGLTPRPSVRLKAEVGGRKIGGPEFFTQAGGMYWKNVAQGPTQRMVNLVPRVIGLSPEQALDVLRSQDFRPQLSGPAGSQIVRQDPQPDDAGVTRTRHADRRAIASASDASAPTHRQEVGATPLVFPWPRSRFVPKRAASVRR